MNNENWQWWRYFLVICQKGSLSQAAELLDISQPTLSRHLQAMEKQLGQSLFNRSTQGLSLTTFGSKLLDECEQMQISADRLQRLATGHSGSLVGNVRLTANELIALHYLPSILPLFMDAHPKVSLEIEVSNSASNIDKRDADVALRMFPPVQQDLVCRHLFNISLGFYASQDYLTKHAVPKTTEDFFNLRILGFDRDRYFEEGSKAAGFDVKNDAFMFRTDFMPLHLAIAKNHGGVVVTHDSLCIEAGLVKIDIGIPLSPLPVYLVCHRDVQHNKIIRALMDFLAEQLPKRANLTANC